VILIRFEPDVRLAAPEPGVLAVTRDETVALRLTPHTVDVLTTPGITVTDLDTAELRATVERLARAGLLHYACGDLARAHLASARATFGPTAVPDDRRVLLSRFAVLRRDTDRFVLDVPVAGTRIEFGDPRAVALLGELHRPRLPAEVDAAFVALLVGAGAAGIVDADDRLPEDHHPVLRLREPADVALHAASRTGLTDRPLGGTYRFADEVTPAPALRAAYPGRSIALIRPPVDDADVLERRRSSRRFGTTPITLDQLGVFLHRAVRVRAIHPAGDVPYETTDRPYASGGAVYDLEVYVTALRCAGLPPAVYHYDPAAHALVDVGARPRHVVGLLAAATRAAGTTAAPQVLVTLAARFDRAAWKYQGIAYALTLKNVGVLYATMHLVATALDLAGCPLGNGDAALFAEATGTDPVAESSVGEFLLGTPESDTADLGLGEDAS
jgi:SagB-type dehydrogenase family enzyme